MKKRLFRAEFGPTWNCPYKSCLFCEHCTDMFWDYTNGPYMFSCDIDGDTTKGYEGKCKKFADRGYVYTPITEEDRKMINDFLEELYK